MAPLRKILGTNISLAPNRGEQISVVGDTYTFLVTGEETEGMYSLFLADVYPGGGPPPHYHTREIESFYVLEGQIEFYRAGEKIIASPGSFVQVATHTVHRFTNATSTKARMLIHCAPSGIEEMFRLIGSPVSDPHAPPAPPTEEQIAKIVEGAAQYGVMIVD